MLLPVKTNPLRPRHPVMQPVHRQNTVKLQGRGNSTQCASAAKHSSQFKSRRSRSPRLKRAARWRLIKAGSTSTHSCSAALKPFSAQCDNVGVGTNRCATGITGCQAIHFTSRKTSFRASRSRRSVVISPTRSNNILFKIPCRRVRITPDPAKRCRGKFTENGCAPQLSDYGINNNRHTSHAILINRSEFTENLQATRQGTKLRSIG